MKKDHRRKDQSMVQREGFNAIRFGKKANIPYATLTKIKFDIV